MQPKTKSPFQKPPPNQPLKTAAPWFSRRETRPSRRPRSARCWRGTWPNSSSCLAVRNAFPGEEYGSQQHNICRTPAWEINRAPMISPIRAAKFGATKSILASAWRQDAYSRLAGHWHWCSLYCCFKAPRWNCNSWMTGTRKLEFWWNRPWTYSKFLWAVALPLKPPPLWATHWISEKGTQPSSSREGSSALTENEMSSDKKHGRVSTCPFFWAMKMCLAC